MIRAALFDLDDTLIVDDPATWAAFHATAQRAASRDAINPQRLAATARSLSVSLWSGSEVFGFCDRLGIHGYECLWGLFDDPGTEFAALRDWTREFRKTVWQEALREEGVSDLALAGELDGQFGLERRARLALMPGAMELLAALRPSLRLGLITNGAPSLQHEKIEALGLASHFEQIVISGEIDIGKPAPGIFHHIARALDVPPAECVVIGNSLSRDIAGARAAGMESIWLHVKGCGDEGDAEPDATVRHLGEVPEALRHLCQP